MEPTIDQGDGAGRVKAKPGYVYFIQADETQLIKIGWGRNPWARLATLQIGCPDELELLAVIESDEAPSVEGRLHHKFRNHRVRGEWFKPAPELLAYIEANARMNEMRGVYYDPAPPPPPARVDAKPLRAAAPSAPSTLAPPSRKMSKALHRYLAARGLPA